MPRRIPLTRGGRRRYSHRVSAETDPQTLAAEAARTLLDRFGLTSIDVALVLGSGWSGAASGLGEALGESELADLPGFARPVVVGHGGFGTTMTALAAGVPQVILPLFSLDQRINAASVAARGAGLNVDGGPSAVAALPAAVNLLLDDTSYRDAAHAVAAEMAALPPVAEAVTVLERLASP